MLQALAVPDPALPAALMAGREAILHSEHKCLLAEAGEAKAQPAEQLLESQELAEAAAGQPAVGLLEQAQPMWLEVSRQLFMKPQPLVVVAVVELQVSAEAMQNMAEPVAEAEAMVLEAQLGLVEQAFTELAVVEVEAVFPLVAQPIPVAPVAELTVTSVAVEAQGE